MNLKRLLLLSCLMVLPFFLMAQLKPSNCVRAESTYTPNPNVATIFNMTLGGSTQVFTYSGDQKDFCFLSLPLTSFTLRFRYDATLPTDIATINFSAIDALPMGGVLSVPSGGCTIFKITKLPSFSVVGSTYHYNLYVHPFYPC